MFNHGKFNIKRFNLPSADNTEIVYRDDLSSALKALVDLGQNYHLQEKQSGSVNAAVIVGSLIDASALCGDALSALVKLKADYIEAEQLSDSFSYDSVELREAVGKLDDESKLLLSMSVLGGYTSDEISSLCGIKPTTVRSKLSRIKQKLRLELTPEI